MTRGAKLWAELTGLGVALSLALIGLLHIMVTARADFLFNDGDSVLMPLISNSLSRGEAFQWVMSTTLFIPEIVQYLAVHWLFNDNHAAIAASGVLNIVLLYAATRMLAASALHQFSRRRQIVASLTGLALFVGLGFFETTAGGVPAAQFEVFTMSYTLTYYSATLIAALLMLAAAAALPRCSNWSQRIWLFVGVAAVSMVSALSNPLYLGWATVPTALVLALVMLQQWRRLPQLLLPTGLLVLVLGTSSYLGYRARHWFEPFLGVTTLNKYVHSGQAHTALSSLLSQLNARADSPFGIAAVFLLMLGAFWMLFCCVRGLWHREPSQATMLLYPTVAAVVLVTGVLMTGQAVPRYLLPVFLLPVLTLPLCVLALWPSLGAWRPSWLGQAGLIHWIRVGVGSLTAVLLVATGISVANTRNAKADCLQDWLSQQNGQMVGAGGFWTSRDISAYLPKQIMLQTIAATNYSWMSNLATFAQPEVDYVLVSDSDVPIWGGSSADEFLTVAGKPAAATQCDGFDIWDYRGTSGQQALYNRIILPAVKDRMARFGCTPSDDPALCETAKQEASF